MPHKSGVRAAAAVVLVSVATIGQAVLMPASIIGRAEGFDYPAPVA